VIVLDLKMPEHDLEVLDRALKLAAPALTMPRKMLSNAIRVTDTERIVAAGLDPSARPGTVPLAGWVRLAQELEQQP
jgi:16S rRNA A1518/A1519 N6-dimethyltransferase RsmA/KsgA/DIM1 with predicted DNA glycosylase/AP lyase activity